MTEPHGLSQAQIDHAFKLATEDAYGRFSEAIGRATTAGPRERVAIPQNTANLLLAELHRLRKLERETIAAPAVIERLAFERDRALSALAEARQAAGPSDSIEDYKVELHEKLQAVRAVLERAVDDADRDLEQYVVTGEGLDPLRLVHEPCGALLAEVEADDTVRTLMVLAYDHVCTGSPE